MKEFENVVAEECKFEFSAKNEKNFLEISDCQGTDAKKTNRQSSRPIILCH